MPITKIQNGNGSFTVIFFFRDLGAHIDGFIAVVAHTLIIGASDVSNYHLLWCIMNFSLLKLRKA